MLKCRSFFPTFCLLRRHWSDDVTKLSGVRPLVPFYARKFKFNTKLGESTCLCIRNKLNAWSRFAYTHTPICIFLSWLEFVQVGLQCQSTEWFFWKFARAGERTRVLLVVVYFHITLPLSHSGCPVSKGFEPLSSGFTDWSQLYDF
jgi:hypothetical protein